MHRSFGFLILLGLASGCGAELSKSDLGTVVFEVPKVAGADEPYKMPQLGPPAEQSADPLGRGP